MKTRAAVAFEAKKPLEIVEFDLEGNDSELSRTSCYNRDTQLKWL